MTSAELIDTLWEDRAPANATGNLQSYVSRLRRLVGGDRIVHEHGGYRLGIDDDHVDIGRVEGLIAEVRTTTDPAARADVLDEALAIWRGEPLADLADAPAFDAQRARLSALHQRLLLQLIEARLASGEAARVLPDLDALATDHPLDEEVHLLFMRGTHQLGRTADAMRVARHFRQRIVEARVGDLERAQGFIAAAEPWVEALWAQGGWRAALDEARGHVAGASGDHLTARTLLQAAAERFASIEQPLDAARCLAALADSERLG